ncbi:hypothetical protein H8F06_21475 [Vibrio fluvialis]|uniref:DUF6950 family protein n=1 Tax=Vibrio fluvialis TaxID=676 RepID=UPI00192AF8D8|nr:hypothetical protein [Vibrio fluvialis]MBL4297853.1 hypothetical protein [Vibrio fluvialis]
MKQQNWMKALTDVITNAQRQPFSWGHHDCCLFAADCALAVAGVDPAAEYRGRYSTELGAKRALTKIHGSIESAFDAHFQRVDPAFVQRGDIVLIESALGRAAGVVWAHSIWSVSPKATGPVDLKPLIAWRVE